MDSKCKYIELDKDILIRGRPMPLEELLCYGLNKEDLEAGRILELLFPDNYFFML